LPLKASPPGCPATPEADQVARGTVASDNDWSYAWLDPKRLWPFTTGRGVRVAVVDSGVNAHRQLNGAVHAGLDLVRGGGDGRLDCIGRGTALASLIAARPARGLAGLAPEAEIVPVRVTEGATTMSPHDRELPPGRLAAGIRWAADAGIPVIDVGVVTAHSSELESAVAHAVAKGSVVVAPVGENQLVFPAAYPGVIGVGAIDRQGNRGKSAAEHVDLYAPGLNVVVAARDTDHFLWGGGADAAAAIVSATAALVKASSPEATGERITARLLATATGGLVDPYRAVHEMLGKARSLPAPDPIAKAAQPQSTLPGQALSLAGLLLAAAILVLYFTRLARRAG
jgi:subtilisin family serine protease